MSNAMSTACRPLQMPPTAKAVLMAMADFADDQGHCWPSIAGLCEYTCFGKSAVIEAIKALEKIGVVIADRSDRYRTNYTVRVTPSITAELVRVPDKSVSRTTPSDGGLVREPDNEVREPDNEVREPDTNHQEPSRTISKATTKKKRADAPPPGKAITAIKGTPVPSMPDGVAPQTWADWLGLRKAKAAPVTETVLREAEREAAKAGLTLTRFLEIWCSRGSQGLQADWLKPNERAGPGLAVNRPSAAANFRETTYADTSIDDLPPDLRDAARAAIAEH